MDFDVEFFGNDLGDIFEYLVFFVVILFDFNFVNDFVVI